MLSALLVFWGVLKGIIVNIQNQSICQPREIVITADKLYVDNRRRLKVDSALHLESETA